MIKLLRGGATFDPEQTEAMAPLLLMGESKFSSRGSMGVRMGTNGIVAEKQTKHYEKNTVRSWCCSRDGLQFSSSIILG
jgi:hypothetical protein